MRKSKVKTNRTSDIADTAVNISVNNVSRIPGENQNSGGSGLVVNPLIITQRNYINPFYNNPITTIQLQQSRVSTSTDSTSEMSLPGNRSLYDINKPTSSGSNATTSGNEGILVSKFTIYFGVHSIKNELYLSPPNTC